MGKREQDRFVAFVNERQAIYDRREAGHSKPWTKDKILQQYRFCNVQRENDRVTKWIAHNWRDVEDPDIWFAMVVARHINAPLTLEHLGFPIPWNKKHFYKVIRERQKKGLRIYNAAYMIVPRQTVMPKDEYLAERIFDPMWKDREKVRPRVGDTLEGFFDRLNAFWGMGTFMTAQVIADLKYVAPLNHASDWFSFVKSGPGSKRGLNRIHKRDIHGSWTESNFKSALVQLHNDIQPELLRPHLSRLHLQDLQNCLCEFDKYERARTGQGTPKQKYHGEV